MTIKDRIGSYLGATEEITSIIYNDNEVVDEDFLFSTFCKPQLVELKGTELHIHECPNFCSVNPMVENRHVYLEDNSVNMLTNYGGFGEREKIGEGCTIGSFSIFDVRIRAEGSMAGMNSENSAE
ncbi:MAG: hypothetical protein N4A31_02500 [Rickettsiales bacterium]|nr:hypothetical protein [Rickettsiales bacterium]